MKKLIAFTLILATLIVSLISCKKQEPSTSPNVVNLSVLGAHDDVQALIVKGEIDVAILPEPKATAAINAAKQQGVNYSITLNLSEEWSAVSEFPLAMGCLAANTSSLNSKEGEIANFLSEYKSSIQYVNDPVNHDSAANMIVNEGILPKLPIAKSALTNLYGSIVYQDAGEMKNTLKAFYQAIGIDQPSDSFYYMGNEVAVDNGEKLVIGVMNGPTGMGMAKLMNDNKDNGRYEFRIYSTPETAIVDLKSGELDLACLPTNAVANAANKGMPITVTAINTLGSLYIVVKEGVTVNSIADLVGKTVYYGVPTSTTQPIFAYILSKYNIDVKVLDE